MSHSTNITKIVTSNFSVIRYRADVSPNASAASNMAFYGHVFWCRDRGGVRAGVGRLFTVGVADDRSRTYGVRVLEAVADTSRYGVCSGHVWGLMARRL